MEPQGCPVLLEGEHRGVADDVVHAPADAEGVHHQRDRQPQVLVANGANESACKVHQPGGWRFVGRGVRGAMFSAHENPYRNVYHRCFAIGSTVICE